VGVRERFAQLAEESGLSHAEIGRRIGKSRNWVNKRVRGELNLLAEDVPPLAAALGVHPCDFFQDPHWELRARSSPSGRPLSSPHAPPGDYVPSGADRMLRDFLQLEWGLVDDDVEVVLDTADSLRRHRGRRPDGGDPQLGG
jgi:transcriptional regulator with XRE-family HTH domain